MEIDVTHLRARDAYALLTSAIVPRPIALVSTLDPDGRTNVAPFSYFSGLCSRPALVTLGIANRSDGGAKDTLRNAQASGVLCINLVEEAIAEAMNASSADLPPDVSEFDVVGLTPLPCHRISCVRVAESRLSLECRLVDCHPYGDPPGVNLVVAEVLHAHVDDALLDPASGTGPTGTLARLSPTAMSPVARLGGTAFATRGQVFHLERPRS